MSAARREAKAAVRGEARAGARARTHAAPLCLLLLLLLLLAPASGTHSAQSGRRSAPPQHGGAPTPTPTPFVTRPTGPIAEPPPPPPKTAPPKKTIDRVRPPKPGTTQVEQPEQSGGEVGEDEVVRISSNLVPVPASVMDANGRPVTDLKAEDFELRVDGVVKPIGELSRSETPVSIALLFDNSSSLNASREFQKQAAVSFLRAVVRPVDRAAVYSISTVPELSHPLTNDVRALVRTIENFGKPVGATALFDTVAAASLYLKPQKTRKVMVIISDGTDTVSDLDFDAALAQVMADDCQIYAVQTGNSESANLHDLAGARRFQEFAAQTGGAVYVPRDNPGLTSAFKQIAAELEQQYVLSYYPSAEPRDGRFRAFTLRVTTRPNLRVRTRKGYYAPKG